LIPGEALPASIFAEFISAELSVTVQVGVGVFLKYLDVFAIGGRFNICGYGDSQGDD
jgi:hypothetical protein